MKHFISTGLLLFLICESAISQTKNAVNESPILYFNNFQKFTHNELNADSAFFYIKKLASNKQFEPLLKDLLHNSFVQVFFSKDLEGEIDTNRLNIRNKRLLLSKTILNIIKADTTSLLKEVAKPIILWIEIQDNPKNIPLLTILANEFLTQQLTPSKFYSNKTGRYGLLIHKIISEQPDLKSLASEMFNYIKDNLKSNQKTASELTTRAELNKRAWYRYLFAFVSNYEASITIDTFQKQVLLKTAFDFSPDLTDKNHQSAYFYDMYFLGDTETFADDYLTFLVKNTHDKKQVLQTLLKMALTEPKYKEKLNDFYTENNSTGVTFLDFWTESVENKAEPSPTISAIQIDKKLFLSEALHGKWVLMDFWGTWCTPCREEHPDLQKFYDQLVLQNSSKIALLTIACNDTEDKVVKYMKEKGYSFPVVMSDGNFETNFKVQSYPTKILLTPKGKFITVPFNIDWASFVKKYSNL